MRRSTWRANLGIDADDLMELANSDVTTAALRASATFGADLGLTATPSYLIGRRAYVGASPAAAEARCDRGGALDLIREH